MQFDDTVTSPSILTLENALLDNKASALAEFWAEIVTQGTPLVESLEDDLAHVLLTFLWRGNHNTQNVVVISPLNPWNFSRNQMQHIPDTNVWYKTYKVPRDLRMTYQLSLNDSLIEDADVIDKNTRASTFQPDPLNSQRFVFPVDKEHPQVQETVVSCVELPLTSPDHWTVSAPSIPAGTITLQRICSQILHNERRIWIYTPANYTPHATPYALLILLDGWAYIHLIPTPTILDNLLHTRKIPPLITLFVDNPNDETRNNELTCSQLFVDFLTQELLPWVRNTYHITSDPAQTLIGGSSYGGLAATFAGLVAPDTFGLILSQSGSFWWKPHQDKEYEWLSQQYITQPTHLLRFYVEVGLLEDRPIGIGPSLLLSNRHMRDILRAEGHFVHYAEYMGDHDYFCWRATFAQALLTLLQR